MSLLTTGLNALTYMRPNFNQATDASGTITASSSVLVTPAAAAAEGEMLVALIGGESSVTITGLPAGWTQIATGVGTRLCSLCYKVATGSEPANYTFTLSGSMTNGGWWFGSSPYVDTTNPILLHTHSSATGTSVGVTYDCLGMAIGFSLLAMSAEEVWSANNGYSTTEAGDRFRIGVRLYNTILRSQSHGWSGPVSASVSMNLILMRGRRIV